MSSKKNRGLGRGLSALMSDLGATDDEAPINDDVKSDDDVMEEITKDGPIETKSMPLSSRPFSMPSDAQDASPTQKKTDSDPKGPATTNPSVRSIAINRLDRNPDQPRKVFANDKLDDLIASIQQRGVLQPILVRPISGETGHFQIVAGERRWQAALKAGLGTVPVIIRELSDRDVLEIGVIENVQRADLNPIEEAMAYGKLIDEFGRTQQEISETIGKSRVHVANTVRLLKLSERARDALLKNKISAGHARALLSAEKPDALLSEILDRDWSVREAEQWVKREKAGGEVKPARKTSEKLPDILALERKLRDGSGLSADIRHKGDRGEIRLKYNSLEEMERILKRIDGADR